MMFTSEVATGASMRFQALVDGESAEGEIPFLVPIMTSSITLME